MQSYQIREIKIEDNPRVAEIIRKVMTEFECVGDGYSINDPEVDQMFQAYQNEGSKFYVIENEVSKNLLGCGGIAHLKGAEDDVCELQKMYFLSELRGLGMGQRLLDICIGIAKNLGYANCYLETTDRMKAANKLYQKNGFKKIKGPLGNTGHCGCDAFYSKELVQEKPFLKLLDS